MKQKENIELIKLIYAFKDLKDSFNYKNNLINSAIISEKETLNNKLLKAKINNLDFNSSKNFFKAMMYLSLTMLFVFLSLYIIKYIAFTFP